MHYIIDVTGDDIAKLEDDELRTLVARLALAELGAQGLPLVGVTAGGNQDASDGGLDVHVDCGASLPRPSFVQRAITGFQVKKPDMPPHAIESEMRPKGILRPSIKTLIDQGGAYIIVSGQGTLTKSRLDERRRAIANACSSEANAGNLAVDFYDRDRLATWVNCYPGVATWVRTKANRALTGWSAIGDWIDTSVNKALPLIVNETACVEDETLPTSEFVTVEEGIDRLRVLLGRSRESARLVGMSGVGKTRLVHALFEASHGRNALDPSMAIYTDYGLEPTISAREIAQHLVQSGTRAILVVDNCNAATHAALTSVCVAPASRVSLLTVEYDIQEDQPEKTDVFRLYATSTDVVADWLAVAYPFLSSGNADKIVKLSDGNFRVAAAMADALLRHPPTGQLKSRELFDRLFYPRGAKDPETRKGAEDLSLLFSVDGTDTSEGSELATIAKLRAGTADSLFEVLSGLHDRGLVQRRGQWRAVLPQAIANRLAADAVRRIPPASLDAFGLNLSERALRSFARRMGVLHDSPEAQNLLTRWTSPGGLLYRSYPDNDTHREVLASLAPLNPPLVLATVEAMFKMHPVGELFIGQQAHWVRLIRSLAVGIDTFDTVAFLLAKFVLAESEKSPYPIAEIAFSSLFFFNGSDTPAPALQRRNFIRSLAEDPDFRAVTSTAVSALLVAEAHSTFARFGPLPATTLPKNDSATEYDQVLWVRDALFLAVELDGSRLDTRALLAKQFSALWRKGHARGAVLDAMRAASQGSAWVDGWVAASAVSCSSPTTSDSDQTALAALIDELAPQSLHDRARAIVLSGHRASSVGGKSANLPSLLSEQAVAATQIGRELARDETVRRVFLREVFECISAFGAFACGQGLCEAASEPDPIWEELISALRISPFVHSLGVPAGFIKAWTERDGQAAGAALDRIAVDDELIHLLPVLENSQGLGEAGARRLLSALKTADVDASHFRALAVNNSDVPGDLLSEILFVLATRRGGREIALQILRGRVRADKSSERPTDTVLVEAGLTLLSEFSFNGMDERLDDAVSRTIETCCHDDAGASVVYKMVRALERSLAQATLSPGSVTLTLSALLKVHPSIALGIVLVPVPKRGEAGYRHPSRRFAVPIGNVAPHVTIQWATEDPSVRFAALGRNMALFMNDSSAEGDCPSSAFLDVLAAAPDKKSFLGDIVERLMPTTWSSTTATILEKRFAALDSMRLSVSGLDAWLRHGRHEVNNAVADERRKAREREESFEP